MQIDEMDEARKAANRERNGHGNEDEDVREQRSGIEVRINEPPRDHWNSSVTQPVIQRTSTPAPFSASAIAVATSQSQPPPNSSPASSRLSSPISFTSTPPPGLLHQDSKPQPTTKNFSDLPLHQATHVAVQSPGPNLLLHQYFSLQTTIIKPSSPQRPTHHHPFQPPPPSSFSSSAKQPHPSPRKLSTSLTSHCLHLTQTSSKIHRRPCSSAFSFYSTTSPNRSHSSSRPSHPHQPANSLCSWPSFSLFTTTCSPSSRDL